MNNMSTVYGIEILFNEIETEETDVNGQSPNFPHLRVWYRFPNS